MQKLLSTHEIQLIEASTSDGIVVHLKFKDGREFDLDLSPDLEPLYGPLVDPLRDPSCFAKMEIKHGTLVFPTGLDYGQDILRIWCENGGVTDQEGTDKLAALYLPYKELSLQIA
jgi:hypothetical protein